MKRTPCLLVVLLAVVVLVLAWGAADAPSTKAGAPLSASFDYSVKDRFGLDLNGDTLIDYFAETSDIDPTCTSPLVEPTICEIDPAEFPVDFDACASSPGANPIVEYRWEIDGVPQVPVAGCDWKFPSGFSHAFPDEGSYEVKLTVEDSVGSTATVTQTVIVQDWLIVSLGDSYGSGEGNPDIPIPPDAIIDYEALAGALAATTLELGQIVIDLAQNLLDLTGPVGAEHLEQKADKAQIAANTVHKNAHAAYKSAIDAQTLLVNRVNAVNHHCFIKVNFFLVPDSIPNCTAALQALLGETYTAALLVKLVANDTLSTLVTAAQKLVTNTGSTLQTAAKNLGDANHVLQKAEKLVQLLGKARVLLLEAKQDAEKAINNLEKTKLPAAEAALELTWQDERCHRSAIAGSAQAALAIEKADPRTSVTFVHLACSGAKAGVGLLAPYQGAEPATFLLNCEDTPEDTDCIPAQVKEAALLVGDREIDALYMSVGGNDINFADILIKCMFNLQCHTTASAPDGLILGELEDICNLILSFFSTPCSDYHQEAQQSQEPGPAQDLFDEGMALLPGLFGQLDDRLPKLMAGRVYISEYPNATRFDDGNYCDPNIHENTFPGLSLDETEWADLTVTVGLNGAIADTSLPVNQGGLGWNLIGGPGGLYDLYEEHGYCANGRWLVRLDETFDIQGDRFGTMHPNADGHGAYRDEIYAGLIADFYPGGLQAPPRKPVNREAVVCNSNGNHSIELGVVDTNVIPCWTVVDQAGSAGSWCNQAGTAPPDGAACPDVTAATVPSPPEALQAAMTNQSSSSSSVLYRCSILVSGPISFELYINNRDVEFHSPASLDYTGGANQQFRADLVTKAGITADPFTVAGPDILLNLYQTQPLDPTVSGYTTIAVDAMDASDFVGQNVCLRFAVTNNTDTFFAGIDDVQFELKKKPTPTPTATPTPVRAESLLCYVAAAVDLGSGVPDPPPVTLVDQFQTMVVDPGPGDRLCKPAAPDSQTLEDVPVLRCFPIGGPAPGGDPVTIWNTFEPGGRTLELGPAVLFCVPAGQSGPPNPDSYYTCYFETAGVLLDESVAVVTKFNAYQLDLNFAVLLCVSSSKNGSGAPAPTFSCYFVAPTDPVGPTQISHQFTIGSQELDVGTAIFYCVIDTKVIGATPTPSGPTATPTITPTPTKQPDPGDTDLDGCSDQAENGPNQFAGGQRDYLYFWDFFDVWTHPLGQPTVWIRDKVVNVPGDILGTASRFGPGTAPGSKGAAIVAALTPPVSDSGYHVAFDRGPVIGANNWNRAPADGAINIPDDIIGVAFQFGHSCL